MTIAIGKSGVTLAAIASMYNSESETYENHEIRVELTFDDENAKIFFDQIEAEKEKIESEIPHKLYWHNPPEKKSCRIYIKMSTDLRDKKNWPEQIEWLLENLELFYNVFHNHVKKLRSY